MKNKFIKQITVLLLTAAMVLSGCSTSAGKQDKDEPQTAAQESDTAAQDSEEEERETSDSAVIVNTDEDGFPIADLVSVTGEAQVQQENLIDDNYRMYYQVFVYSFCDSNGDGTGDLQGVVKRLDYIRDLGCNGIWLMPVMPSNTYHKYDVKDYYEIDAEYGTLDDFKKLIAECEKRGIKVILDLVVNHTSASHEWYQSAAEYLRNLPDGQEPDAGECPYVEYYNFTKEQGSGYVPLSGTDWYYEAQFWDQMPDLNLDNAAVRGEFEKIISFWTDLGAGGFRLDAAKEYFSGNSGKNTEVLKWLNDYCKGINPDIYLVAEVWDSFDIIEQYYESGIDSIFDFQFGGSDGTLAKTVLNAGNGTSGKTLADKIIECQNRIAAVNEKAIDAPFFSNHDIGRIAGFLRHDLDKMKFAGAVNVLMSGSAFLYYGEELGMDGSVKGSPGKDENKRAPMYWQAAPDSEADASAAGDNQADASAGDNQADASAADNQADASAAEDMEAVVVGWGMTEGPSGMDNVVHEFGSYEEQMCDADSIYNYYRRLIRIRNAFPQIARGAESAAEGITDGDICAVQKDYDGETLYLIMNNGTEEKTIAVPEPESGGAQLAAYLTTLNAQTVTLEGGTLTLPPYGIAVIK